MRALLLALLLLAPLTAQADEQFFTPPLPDDFDQVDVYLLTVGRGDQIYSLFGHTILRIVDRKAHLDMNFNWGIFDYGDPFFLWKFYRGDLTYRMMAMDFGGMLQHYRDAEKRRVIQERINLTAAQKKALMERVILNSKPENVFYRYWQYRDNCSTRVRDHLDAAIGGKIKARYGERPGHVTIRHHAMEGLEPFWWANMGYDLIGNAFLDQSMTNWEEMFLPAKLRTYMLDLPAYDDNGDEIPGKNLLEQTEYLVDQPEPDRARHSPYWLAALLIGFPALFAGLRQRRALREGSTAVRAESFAVLLVALWSSVLGTMMTFNMIFTYYPELASNALLLLYWPTDWIIVLWALRRLISGRTPEPTRLVRLGLTPYALLHVAGIVVLLVLWAVGIVKQAVLPALGVTAIPAVWAYLTIARTSWAKDD